MGGREHLLDCSTLGVGFSCIDDEFRPFCEIASECPTYDPVNFSYPQPTCVHVELLHQGTQSLASPLHPMHSPPGQERALTAVHVPPLQSASEAQSSTG